MTARRAFLRAAGLALLAAPHITEAQPGPRYRIGFLGGASAAGYAALVEALRLGLRDHGYVEGTNLTIDYRWADGRIERMREFAADFVRRQVAIIFTGGSNTGVRDVVAATKTIPIVFTSAIDPVATGLVASLNRPGGNATGVTFIGSELVGKQLELLREIMPNATRVAALANQNNPVMAQDVIRNAQTAARRLGLDIIVIHASTESEIDAAFTHAVKQQASALFADDA
jgi:putative ABC transport system substrate-binding protein